MPQITNGRLLYLYRGDTFVQPIRPRLGDITARQELWFTVKREYDDTDAESMIQISETTGLVYINGAAAAVPTNGAISIVNAKDGSIEVLLSADETAKLESCEGKWYYDVQVEYATGIFTLLRGEFLTSPDVTRTTGAAGAGNYVLWPNGAPVLWPPVP